MTTTSNNSPIQLISSSTLTTSLFPSILSRVLIQPPPPKTTKEKQQRDEKRLRVAMAMGVQDLYQEQEHKQQLHANLASTLLSNDVAISSSLSPIRSIPPIFESVEQYKQIFKDIILEEIREQIETTIKSRENVKRTDELIRWSQLLNTGMAGMSEIMLEFGATNNNIRTPSHPSFVNEFPQVMELNEVREGDVVLLCPRKLEIRRDGMSGRLKIPWGMPIVLAVWLKLITNNNNNNSTMISSSSSSFRCRVIVPNTFLSQLTKMNDSTITCLILANINLISPAREFYAISSFSPNHNLYVSIVIGDTNRQNTSRTQQNSSNIQPQILQTTTPNHHQTILSSITTSFQCNEKQIEAIKRALELPVGHISLIQGPPGTGKTKTIQAIVHALGINSLLGSLFPLNSNNNTTTTTQDSFLKLLTSSRNAPTTLTSKILLVATTNQAVENLVDVIQGKNNHHHDRRVVHFTTKLDGNVHQQVLSLIQRFQQMNLQTVMEQYDDVLKHISALQIQITEFIFQNQSQLLQDTSAVLTQLNRLAELCFERDILLVGRGISAITTTANSSSSTTTTSTTTNNNNIQYTTDFRRVILEHASIVLCTLSQCGHELMQDLSPIVQFNCCIIDEAAQASEPSTWLALQLNPEKTILVGDPRQLPHLVYSSRSRDAGYSISLLERLMKRRFPVTLLQVQYRMRPEICNFVSDIFYESKLITADHCRLPEYSIQVPVESKFGPINIIDVCSGTSSQDMTGTSWKNIKEVEMVIAIATYILLQQQLSSSHSYIAIITPYNAQRSMIQSMMNESRHKQLLMKYVQVGTVDSFQGSENDVVIFSCVRASHGVGFVDDERRLCVATSRAKYAFFMVGNMSFLQTSSTIFGRMIHYLRNKVGIQSEKDVLMRLKRSSS
jgi:hypothetical protein